MLAQVISGTYTPAQCGKQTLAPTRKNQHLDAIATDWPQFIGRGRPYFMDSHSLRKHGQATPLEGFVFTSITAGDDHTCALTDDYRIKCWGSNVYGQSTSPSTGRKYFDLTTGPQHTRCAGQAGSLPRWLVPRF